VSEMAANPATNPESLGLDGPWRIGHLPASPDDWARETRLRTEMLSRDWATGRRPDTDREWELEYSFQQLRDLQDARIKQQELESEQARDANAQSVRSTNVRSWVLLAIVASIIIIPAVAMASGIAAQDFSQYIAPITGIAGTVLGYWFGQQGLTGSSDRKPQPATTTGDQPPSFPRAPLH
jgi:hypothetical protein